MGKFDDLPKAYEASSIEDEIYASWEQSGFFNPDKLPERYKDGEPYAIMMPPPNVTGVLHLGHALENALMDTMARFQRMRGKRVMLVPGTDHAAIATQAKVEKMLMDEGMENPRQELGREKLVERIREFAEQSKSTILTQVKKMGTSADWSRLAYTFDEARNKTVNELFVRMYNDGLIYRGYRVVNWSVKGQSTCSDDEIEYIERPAKLYTFKYSHDFPITIATTRPETKLGDTAVAVHPDDERYKEYIGKTFTVDVGAAKPLEIKVIANEEVDPKFGTGALGVTPAHSPVDFLMYEKQKAKQDSIGIIPVIGKDGRMTEEAGTSYAGLTVEEAREKFVEWLRDQGLLEHEEDIQQSVGTSDRFKDVIEAIPMDQWWLDVSKEIPSRGKSLRDLLRDAVTTGLDGKENQKVKITPERFTKLYLDRVENLRDWCLSRQLWWGHRIPAWYHEPKCVPKQGHEESDMIKCKQLVVSETKPVCEFCDAEYIQDQDTLDTWFSSGTWTFSTLGWPNEEIWNRDRAYHPTAWMQMGYEILYLWLMRMILTSSYLFNEVPFYDAYIHGLLRDKEGKKFSKSSGNNIDPIEVIDQYGCDALRISLLIGISPGNDSRYYTEKIEGGRNFTNKLWNISRFILMQIGDADVSGDVSPKTLADEWILSRLQAVTTSVTSKIEAYDFSSAGEELRDFTWGDLADWYLEIAKIEGKKAVILNHILQSLMKLWHPYMPFVTEHIWKTAGFDGDLIVAAWPDSASARSHGEDFEFLRTLITDMRRLRAEQGIEPAKTVEFAIHAPETMANLIHGNAAVIEGLTRSRPLRSVDEIPEGWATVVSGSTSIGLNVAGSIDVEQEKKKLEKEIEDVSKYLDGLNRKLSNKEFTDKAPESVVAAEQEKQAEAKAKLVALRERFESL